MSNPSLDVAERMAASPEGKEAERPLTLQEQAEREYALDKAFLFAKVTTQFKSSKILSESLKLERAVEKREEALRKINQIEYEIKLLQIKWDLAVEDAKNSHPEYMKVKSRLETANKLDEVIREDTGTINRHPPNGPLAKQKQSLASKLEAQLAPINAFYKADMDTLRQLLKEQQDALKLRDHENKLWRAYNAARNG